MYVRESETWWLAPPRRCPPPLDDHNRVAVQEHSTRRSSYFVRGVWVILGIESLQINQASLELEDDQTTRWPTRFATTRRAVSYLSLTLTLSFLFNSLSLSLSRSLILFFSFTFQLHSLCFSIRILVSLLSSYTAHRASQSRNDLWHITSLDPLSLPSDRKLFVHSHSWKWVLTHKMYVSVFLLLLCNIREPRTFVVEKRSLVYSWIMLKGVSSADDVPWVHELRRFAN